MTLDHLGPDQIDDVRAAFFALVDHHVSLEPRGGAHADQDAVWARKREQYAGVLGEEGGHLIAARADDGTVLGFAIMGYDTTGSPTWVEPLPIGEILDLVVLPAGRSQGTGKALLAECERLARADGAVTLDITVLAANEAATRFYRREGYADSLVTVRKSL